MKNKKSRKVEREERFDEQEQSCCRQVSICGCCWCYDYVYCC